MKNGGRIVQKTKLTILLASFYILGVAAFFTGHVMTFAAVVLVLLIFALFKNYLSSFAVFFAYLFFMLAILNSNLQIKDCDDLCKFAENNITLTGTVISIPTTNSDDLTKFYFKPVDGIFNAQKIDNLKARTIVTVYGNKSEYSKIKIGDKIKLQGKLKLPQEAQNPSQFDYRKYLKNHKTFTVMYVKNGNWSIVSSPTSLSWKFLQKLNNKRMDILNIHKKYLKSPNLEVLGGIVFGDDAINPPDSIRDSFINSGLLHILAASGMNVSIIFGMWYFIAVRLRINYRFILIFGAILVAAYTLMTGMGPSVLRAALMIELVLLGKFFDRDADSFSLIFFVAMALLVYNPAMITDIGFQLSFIVTFALMFYCPPVLEKINNKFLDILTGAILIPIVAQLWAAPIQMYYFNTFATYSVLANFLISPLITAISFLGFVGSTLALFPLIAAKTCLVFDFLLNPIVTLLIKISDFVSELPNSLIVVPNPSVLQCLLYFSMLVVLGFAIKYSFKKKILICLSILFVLFGLSFIKIPDKNCKILVFSVGNADCFLIKTPKNKHIMIDTARGSIKDGGFSITEAVVSKYLKNKAINNIDYLILTHYDADHIGGSPDIIESVKVKEIILNENKKATSTEQRILDGIKSRNIPTSLVKNNKILYSEPGLVIKTFVPDLKYSKNPSNDTSTIVLLTYGDFDMLFMADAGTESFRKIKQYLPEDIEVIKTGHHGARNTVDNKMLKHNHFDTAIISTGKNSYGHPDKRTLNTLINNGVQYYRTDVENAIEIVSDGFSYKINGFNTEKRKFMKLQESKT